MKSASAVKHQLQQVIFRYIKKQLRDNFRMDPETCVYNKRVVIGQPSKIAPQAVGVCYYEKDESGPRFVICDSLVAGCQDQARSCPMWKARFTKEAIKRNFRNLLQGDKGLIAVNFPDIAALLWVLDTDEDATSLDAIVREAPVGDVCEQPSPDLTSHIPGTGNKSESVPLRGSLPSPLRDVAVPGDEIEGRGSVG